MIWLCRALTLSPMVHYVDDYASIEPECSIQSGFECVQHLMKTVGFKFKPSKDQPPAPTQLIQGVIMSIDSSAFTVRTEQARVQRIASQLEEHLQRGTMSADEAKRLAGKLQFISEAMMSQTIRCCLQTLYARAAAPIQCAQTPMGEGVTDSLITLLHILPIAKPRVFRFQYQPCTVIYADAFFQAGDERLSIRTALDHSGWRADATHLMKNGRGFVLREPCGRCHYAHGEIPGALLGRFTTRRAFIYALEILAQIMCIVPGMARACASSTTSQASSPYRRASARTPRSTDS